MPRREPVNERNQQGEPQEVPKGSAGQGDAGRDKRCVQSAGHIGDRWLKGVVLAVPSAAASAMNQTTGVCRTTTRAVEMTSVCIPTTVGRRTSAVLAEIGHDGGADAK